MCDVHISIITNHHSRFNCASSRHSQISSLVHHRGGGGMGGTADRLSATAHGHSERTLRAIGRVGQAVSLAVERFVCVGETIGDDNPEIRQDMYEACKEARTAGKCCVMKTVSVGDVCRRYAA